MEASPVALAFILAGLMAFAGCADGDSAKAVPSASASSTPQAPSVDPAANLTAVDEPGVAKGQQLSVRFNGTGDLAMRFLLAADRGTPCNVEAAVALMHEAGRENSFSHLEESSGARFTFGGAGTYVRVGPLDTASSSDGDLWAWQSRISGESWGETHYTVAVRDLTWWENEYTGKWTFRLDASCDGDFEIRDLTASREVRMFSQAGLGTGPAVAYGQAGAFAQGEWSAEFAGDDIKVVVLSSAEVMRMAWSTPAEQVEWDGAQQEGGGASVLVLEGPAGRYGATVDMAGSGGFAAVIADLPVVANLQAYLDSL